MYNITKQKKITFKKILNDICSENNSTQRRLMFGEFLDDFYKADNEIKTEMVSNEPIFNDNNINFMIEIAAAVHKLSNEYNIPTPMWVFNEKYYSKKPIYAFNTNNKSYQKFLIETTPKEYAERNIFYGDNVLKRV